MHGTPPSGRGRIERQTFRLPYKDGKSPAWHIAAPALDEPVEPPIGLVLSLAREILKVALGVAATVVFEGENSHRIDLLLLDITFGQTVNENSHWAKI